MTGLSHWQIVFDPFVPMPVLVGLGLAAAILAMALMALSRRGAFLRLLAMAALLLAIANPSLRQETRESLPNIAVVVVDESQSQHAAGRMAEVAAARDALQKTLALKPNLEVRVVTARDRGEGDRQVTELFGALNEALADVPTDRLAGAVLITDGQIHDAPPDIANLGLQAPVHALITGRAGERDRRIRIVRAPKYGLVGQTATVEFTIEETGASDPDEVGERVGLTITDSSGVVRELTAVLGGRIRLQMAFPRAGLNVMEIAIEEADGEITTANNRAVILAQGVRENLRVLLVSGEPHAGERTWRNLLKSDAAVDLIHFTILRPPEKQDGTPIRDLSLIAFPTRELFVEKLDEFDLIIFDRYQRRGVLPLPYLANVSGYVERGGAVLIATDQSFAGASSLYRTPLADIIPGRPTGRTIEQPFRASVTALGARHPVTRDLPGANLSPEDEASWGRWFRVVEAETGDSDVIMSGAEDAPLLALNRRGDGRVALLLSDHAWLWARGYDGGGPHSLLLRRLAHWLMKEPDLEEESLIAQGGRDTLTITRHTMATTADPVEVETPSGERRTVPLSQASGEGQGGADAGTFGTTIEAREPGLYRVRSGTLSAIAHVGAQGSRELADVVATDAVLKPVFGTRGGIFWTGSVENGPLRVPRVAMMQADRTLHGADWLGLRDRQAYVVRSVTLTPLFAGFGALAALLALAAATWYREGR